MAEQEWIYPVIAMAAFFPLVFFLCFCSHYCLRPSLETEDRAVQRERRRKRPSKTPMDLSRMDYDENDEPNIKRWEDFARIWQTPEVATENQIRESKFQSRSLRRKFEKQLEKELLNDMSEMESAFGLRDRDGPWTMWKKELAKQSRSKSLHVTDEPEKEEKAILEVINIPEDVEEQETHVRTIENQLGIKPSLESTMHASDLRK